MFQNPYRFNIYIFMFTNEICPYKSHTHHRDKSCDALHITHMGVLDVEAGRFHGSKGRFYLPSFLYVKIASSGRLKHMRICNSGTPSEFLIRLPAR